MNLSQLQSLGLGIMQEEKIFPVLISAIDQNEPPPVGHCLFFLMMNMVSFSLVFLYVASSNADMWQVISIVFNGGSSIAILIRWFPTIIGFWFTR